MAKVISSRIVAVMVIAMLVVVGIGVASSGVLSSTSSTSASTTSPTAATSSVTLLSSSGLNQNVETSNSTLGLQLVLSVNSTTIPSEDSIEIASSVLNLQSTTNNVTASDDWPVHGLNYGVCPSTAFPAGIAVFRGYYGINNLSSAAPLGIWPVIGCPAILELNVTSYSFVPNGDVANYSGYPSTSSQSPPAKQQGDTPTTFSVSVYAANSTDFVSTLGSALPSTYTVVAGDEWGQIVLLHFKVTPSDLLPKVGNFLSSGGGCSPGPCLGQRLSDALVFNCLQAAATPAGCSEVWSSGERYSAAPMVNYTVTVRYPLRGEPNEPAAANCVYTASPVGGLGVPPPTPSFGYCIPINSTAFVVTLA